MSRNQYVARPKAAFTPEKANDLILKAKDDFQKIVSSLNSRMVFTQEALFAYHAMMSNPSLYETAASNEWSFNLAMQQIASSGLSLNPALGLAFLVPRQGKIIADVSYRGLMKIATDSRAVDLVVAEAVYSGDRFIYNGSTAEPDHVFDPFLSKKDRGSFRGVYVKAYLPSGRLVVDPLSAEDVYSARSLSKAFQHTDPSKRGPWETHFEPMAIKTGIKSASKYWPKTSPVLENVISYLNEEADEGFSTGPISLATAARDMHGTSHAPNVVDLSGNVYEHGQQNEAPQGVVDADAPKHVDGATVQSADPQPQGPSIPLENSKPDGRGDPIEVIKKRIQSVYDRTMKNGSWNAATEWAQAHLRDDLQAEAFALFKRGEAEYQERQKASA